MSTNVKIITESELKTSIRKAMQSVVKKADKQGLDSLLKLWNQVAKDYVLAELSKEGVQTELLLHTKDGKKQWLATIPEKPVTVVVDAKPFQGEYTEETTKK